MEYTRNRRQTKNYGGSYTPPETVGPDGEVPKKFVLKEKITDMMKYAMPLLDSFPRRNRKLADTLRDCLINMLRISIQVERGISRKTNLQKLDVELATVKEFVLLASDKDYCGSKYAPPLTIHEREVWARKNDEIGRMIGGYLKALDNQPKEK